MNSYKWWTTAMFALLLAGCAAAPGGTRPDAPAADVPAAAAPAGVEARAKLRWDLLIAGKADQAYDYLSPGYRTLKTREVYAADMSGRPVRWTRAEVKGSECPPEAGYCDVTVEVHFEMQSTLPGVGKLESFSPIVERWIESDGSWYFVPKEVARNGRGLR